MWQCSIQGHAVRAVELVVQAHPVPVYGPGQVDPVPEPYDDRRIPRYADQRAWYLSIEGVHRERAPDDLTPYEHGGEVQGVTVAELGDFARPSEGQSLEIDSRAGEECPARGREPDETGEHLHPGRHGDRHRR
jgi:hypothetical protein